MRIIILTSAGMKADQVRKKILDILPKPHNKVKIAYIYTAINYKGFDRKRDADSKILKNKDFKVLYFDIKDKTEKEIRSFLKNIDVIYVRGGNSFYLLKYVRRSGFDGIVKELIEQGKIYIGVSAGSYIACPTIEMAHWKNQDKNTVGIRNLKAIGLVPFLVSVHYSSEYRAAIRRGVRKTKYPVRILTDEQAILVRDNKVTLIGKGKEIKV